jgi:polysaccharide export outer membrane protein
MNVRQFDFRRLVHFVLLAMTPAVVVCAQTAPVPDNTPNTETKQPARVAPDVPGVSAAVDSNGYKVESPDILSIRVWHQPDFTGAYSVHPDGKITMPLLGDLQAGGKTPAEIEKTVKEALSKYVKEPIVTVTVQNVLSKKYYMDGEINRPGEYELISPTTILEAISKAGGLAAFANEKKIYILRGDKRIPFNYKDVIHGKHLDQNITLQPGDHVVIP